MLMLMMSQRGYSSASCSANLQFSRVQVRDVFIAKHDGRMKIDAKQHKHKLKMEVAVCIILNVDDSNFFFFLILKQMQNNITKPHI